MGGCGGSPASGAPAEDDVQEDPEREDRAERIERLVWCPVPLRGLVLDAWGADDPTTPSSRRRVVLEVHIRRFYRRSGVGPITFHESDGFLVAATDCSVDGDAVHLVVGYLPLAALADWTRGDGSTLDSLEPDRAVAADVVTWREGPDTDITEIVPETLMAEADAELRESRKGKKNHE